MTQSTFDRESTKRLLLLAALSVVLALVLTPGAVQAADGGQQINLFLLAKQVHGEQEEQFFHGYYDQYCFLPLYVFCGTQLLVSYLRPSDVDGAKHAWAILSLLVKRLRQVWPGVQIIFRGDSGFCRWKLMSW